MARSLWLGVISVTLCVGPLLALACGSESENESGKPGGPGADSADGATTGNPGTGTTTDAGTTIFQGEDCPDLGLPAASALQDVRATVRGGSAQVTYRRFDGAKEYRVYALPPKDKVLPSGAIQDGLSRCAGPRQAPIVVAENGSLPQSYAIRVSTGEDVRGVARKKGDATLGHVYPAPGEGRIPVFALGDSDEDADNSCFFQRWTESRAKVYTTSEAKRAELLAAHFRDDGIAFYVPAKGTAGTVDVEAAIDDKARLYFTATSAEHAKRAGAEVAFPVLTAAADGTTPLQRLHYTMCGNPHDELVAGKASFDRAYEEGPNQPQDRVHWSGVTEPVTLVVEALDTLCPFQGVLSPTARPAHSQDGVDYPPFPTLDAIRAAAPNGEVFVGGQGKDTQPKAIARACVKVAPSPLPAAEFRYPDTGETFANERNAGFQTYRLESPSFDVHLLSTPTDTWGVGTVFGELWTPHADWAADTNGKLRLTAKKKAALAADTFVEVTMEVDAHSSGRRYPQLLVSDVDIPVQDNLEKGTTVIVQTINSSPTSLEVQLCDHRTWDVNNQCPVWDLHHIESGGKTLLAPNVEVNDQTGLDPTNFFHVFVSTKRVYVFFDDRPYGCVDLPAGKLPASAATVTFGDVLYHSGVDLDEWQPFHKANYQVVTSRHYSNLSFSSGRAAPAWDEARFPCLAASKLK